MCMQGSQAQPLYDIKKHIQVCLCVLHSHWKSCCGDAVTIGKKIIKIPVFVGHVHGNVM